MSTQAADEHVTLLPGIDPQGLAIAPCRPHGFASVLASDPDNPGGCVTFAENVAGNGESIEAALYYLAHRDAHAYRRAPTVKCRPVEASEGMRHEMTVRGASHDLLLHVELPEAYEQVVLPASCVFTLYLRLSENGETCACEVPGVVYKGQLGTRLAAFEGRRGLCPLFLTEGVRLAFNTSAPVHEAHDAVVHLAALTDDARNSIVEDARQTIAVASAGMESTTTQENAGGRCVRWFFDSRVDTHTSGFFVERRPVRQFTGVRTDLVRA